jgi:hypothetical protein
VDECLTSPTPSDCRAGSTYGGRSQEMMRAPSRGANGASMNNPINPFRNAITDRIAPHRWQFSPKWARLSASDNLRKGGSPWASCWWWMIAPMRGTP